jgi:hypothetical protein
MLPAVDLLSAHDPVFVVDLTPQTMNTCRADFGLGSPPNVEVATVVPDPPERPVRALALVFAWEEDPVLLSIQPTLDTEMLDAVARLIRAALITRRSIAHLVTEHGDDEMKRLYFSRRLPRFIYDGIPAPVRHRVPAELQQAVGHGGRPRRRS